MSQSLGFEKMQVLLHCEHECKDEDEEKEEEAMSLCDLPVSTSTHEGRKEGCNQTEEDSDFDFGSLIGPISALESRMCVADEVFSGGQMLPFRHSVSSDVGLSGFRVPSRSFSRSDSMDRPRFESRSTSSRSSSTRSHQSATSTSTSSSCSSYTNNTSSKTKNIGIPKPKSRNQFHSYPSPKPQLQASSHPITTSPSGSKSTMWQVLRLGLVRTPEIELQDLKIRHRTSNFNKSSLVKGTTRSNSISSTSSNGSSKGNIQSSKISDLLLEMQKKEKLFFLDKNSGGIFKSCKCSVGAVEPIPTKVRANCGSKNVISGQNKSLSRQLMSEDKIVAQKTKQQAEQQEQQQQNNKHKHQLRQGKQEASHHRTFEWLRDLSHTNVLNA